MELEDSVCEFKKTEDNDTSGLRGWGWETVEMGRRDIDFGG